MASGRAAERPRFVPEERRGGGSGGGAAGVGAQHHPEASGPSSGLGMKMGMNLGLPGAEKKQQQQQQESEQDAKVGVTSQMSSLRMSEGSDEGQTGAGSRPQSAKLATAEDRPGEGVENRLDQATASKDEQPQQPAQNGKPCEVAPTALAAYRVRKVSSDSVIIQSDHGGPEKLPPDPLEGPGRVVPVIDAAATWISTELAEFKEKVRREKAGVMTVRRGNVVTVRVPTHPEGTSICWDFATDTYDIGFGIYFEWAPVTDTEITVLVSESSEEEEDEDAEVPPIHGDIERGTKDFSRSDLEEILPVYRKDSHLEVQSGSHKYPGQGIYLLKFDNSYSIWRHKTLYYQVNYSL
ncbi:protein TMED8 [Pristis pectinata]|uniref:protein TMED8 n=1 Tax=Pristis pectinata TaxID=685728 RepID=UPI00223DC48D|nr:protein TMED8 [Pristis pectinata]